MESTDRIERRIQELKEKLEQGKAQLGKLEARKTQIARKAETRQKILAGAVVLKIAARNPEFKAQLLSWLDKGLTADRDRALFELSNSDGHTVAANDDDTTPSETREARGGGIG